MIQKSLTEFITFPKEQFEGITFKFYIFHVFYVLFFSGNGFDSKEIE